ncbi:hypothetical protein [Ciceribacter sp. L1K22]|uniref:hypothetical protein n=1 Tax=Ciceribacter sp. L1K22 TaxID=2820275 RepID=UPI001ABEA21C|nr:hypothetical protein [Ciceribacter sp. L1K22]MBO3759454.1 hypothetical protein [Ciceribacter sp. L1K22]
MRLALLPLLLLATPAAAADTAAVSAFLTTRLTAEMSGDIGPTRVALAFADLNADGADEVLAYVMGPMWCGSGGCNLLVLTPKGESFSVVMDASVAQMPVGVLPTTSHGWADLAVSVGGGGAASGTVAMRFDGTAYPGNPTVAPAEPVDPSAARMLIDETTEVVTLP